MKNIAKIALGAASLTLISNAYAVTTVNMDVGLTALVQATCNTADAFVNNQDLSTQIESDGSIIAASEELPITNGAIIACNTSPTWTTLNMVSLNHGIKSGAVVLPYKITGKFGSTIAAGPPVVLTPITIADFDSGTGPTTDLLSAAPGDTPEGTPDLWVKLNNQAPGTAVAGNYADTLTLTVITSP